LAKIGYRVGVEHVDLKREVCVGMSFFGVYMCFFGIFNMGNGVWRTLGDFAYKDTPPPEADGASEAQHS